MRTLRLKKFTVAASLATATYFLPLGLRANAQSLAGDAQSAAFEEVINTIQEKYLVPERVHRDDLMKLTKSFVLGNTKDSNSAAALYGALYAVMISLDPHSIFLDPQEFKAQNEHLANITHSIRFDNLKYIANGILFPLFQTNAPVDLTWLRRGDRIITIEGETIKPLMDLTNTHEFFGIPKTPITITIERNGNKTKIIQKDGEYISSPVSYNIISRNIAYIRLATFSKNAGASIRDAFLEMAKTTTLTGVILDLRSNHGGLVDEVVRAAENFLPRGNLVLREEGRDGKIIKNLYTEAEDVTHGLPLVVLINDQTASAAEALTATLQENKRAIVIGATSFGKAIAQDLFEFPKTVELHGASIPNPLQGTAMRLTTLFLYTPKGRSIQRIGITPDYKVDHIPLGKREEQFPTALPNPIGITFPPRSPYTCSASPQLNAGGHDPGQMIHTTDVMPEVIKPDEDILCAEAVLSGAASRGWVEIKPSP